MRRSLIVLGSVALAVPVLVAPLDQVGAGSADAARVRLVGSMPLLPVGVIPSAAVPPDERVEIQVHLLLRDQAGADALALAVATPGNPLRGRYLTPQQFRARFSPTEATVAKVSGWLTSQDLTVTGVPANRFYVAAEGTAAQVEAAFSTALATVEVNGGQRRVNTAEPALPADLASSVAGITGLTQVFAHPARVGGRDELPGGGSTESTADASDTAGRAPAAAPPHRASAMPVPARRVGVSSRPPRSRATAAGTRTRSRGPRADGPRRSSARPTASTGSWPEASTVGE